MRWWTWWVVGWLCAALLVLFAADARAGEPSFVGIHVCVRPPNVPATVDAWTFVNDANSYTVRIPPKDFKKQANGLPIYVYDPFAPPDSVKLYPIKFNNLVCPPPPQVSKLPEEKKEEKDKEKTSAAPIGGAAGPPKAEDQKKAEPKKPNPDEEPPGVIRLMAPPPPQDEHSLPPKGGVTERWPTSVLPFKAPESEPPTLVLPQVKVCGGGVLPFKGATCHKDESDSAVAKNGDPTKKGSGEPKTAFEKFAESIALGGGLLNLQLGEDIHDKDGSKYGVPGGKNKDGIQSATAQAVAGSLMVAAVVISAGGADKKLFDALSKKTPLILSGGGKAAEEAAEKIVDAAIAKYGAHGAEDLAAALAKNGAIGEYSVMAKFTKGLGSRWQAHHILEEALARKFKLVASDRVPSIILSEAEHKLITAQLRLAGTAKAETPEALWAAYQVAYKGRAEWLAAIAGYFGK